MEILAPWGEAQTGGAILRWASLIKKIEIGSADFDIGNQSYDVGYFVCMRKLRVKKHEID